MFTLNISVAVLLSVTLLLSDKKIQVKAEECYSNSDCGYFSYCCKQRHWYQPSVCRYGGCVGLPCSWDSDCGGPGECCNSTNYCTKSSCTECTSNSDCGYNKYCCKQEYSWQNGVCRFGGCVGQPCGSDSDCGGTYACCNTSNYCVKSPCAGECSSNSDCDYSKYCCKRRYYWQSRVCRYGGCVGESCSSDSDCGGPGECCNSTNYCTKSSCTECTSNSDCGYNKYCCKQRYSWQNGICRYGGCVGQPCSSDSDCGSAYACCNTSNYCAESPCTDECSSNSDCGYYKYCCKRRYYWQSHVCRYGGCVGQPCSSDSNCGGPGECCNSTNYCAESPCDECSSNSDCDYNKYCCKQEYSRQSHVCRSGGCVGQPCSSDSDCGGKDEWCSSSNLCTKYGRETKGLASWLIGVIVVSVLVVVVTPIVIVVCCYRASRGRTQQVLELNQPTDSTLVALQNIQTVQNNPSQLQNPLYLPSPYFEDQDVQEQEPLIQDLPPGYIVY